MEENLLQTTREGNRAVTAVEGQRDRKYTQKQKKFLQLYVANEFSQAQECALQAGYTGNYWMVLQALKDDIKQIAESILVEAMPKAAMTLTAGLDKPIPGSMINAAKEVLDRTGVTKPDTKEVDVNISGGLFILPAKGEIQVSPAGKQEVIIEHDPTQA